uniref:Putative secreted protein n=1 Tax=Ixodes ricinus TaxID=34613 RepID=A0A6B0U0X7_IXORI
MFFHKCFFQSSVAGFLLAATHAETQAFKLTAGIQSCILLGIHDEFVNPPSTLLHSNQPVVHGLAIRPG